MADTGASLTYFESVRHLLDDISSESTALETAAAWCAETISSGGLIHVFGSGHSHMAAEEAFHRAGGLVPVNAVMVDWLTSHGGGGARATLLERTSGLGGVIVQTEPVEAGDVFFVVSNSGRNPVPVEVAQAAAALRAKVVAITSVEHALTYEPRAGSARLVDIADLVLDTHVPVGDAAVSVGDGFRAGGLSSIASLAIIQTVVVATATMLVQAGKEPPLFKSANEDGSDEWNAQQILQLGERIPTLLRIVGSTAHPHGKEETAWQR